MITGTSDPRRRHFSELLQRRADDLFQCRDNRLLQKAIEHTTAQCLPVHRTPITWRDSGIVTVTGLVCLIFTDINIKKICSSLAPAYRQQEAAHDIVPPMNETRLYTYPASFDPLASSDLVCSARKPGTSSPANEEASVTAYYIFPRIFLNTS